jgi:transcriptional pleiotropic regulator of transition state genes
MLKFKKLTKNRAVTIPKDIAAEWGVTGGEAISVEHVNGIIYIKKRSPKCRFCGDVEQAQTYKGIDVCPACADAMKGVVSSG